jgi:excisionase family DNA binding protein
MADQNSQIEPMLTTSEVARILNVHINTVRRWSNQGTLKSYRIVRERQTFSQGKGRNY